MMKRYIKSSLSIFLKLQKGEFEIFPIGKQNLAS